MQSVYLGGIVVAGAFTFVPGRIMQAAVFDPVPWIFMSLLPVVIIFAFFCFAVWYQRPHAI